MKPNLARAIIKTMRPKQWAKNVVVFAALVFDRQLTNIPAMLHTLGGFVVFCLISSMVYFINDLVDIEADRLHPEKKHRPIASGLMPIPLAYAIIVLLFFISFPAAYYLSPQFALIGFAYFILNLLYSFWLKHVPLVDIMVIAAGFVLRIAGGVMLISVDRFSPWLYVVTTLLALYLGFGKRRAELALLAGEAYSHRKVLDGYTIPLLDQLITVVSSTTIVAYSLYTFSAPNLPDNNSMMLTIPFALYGIFRYLYLIQVKNHGGAPEDMLFKDRPLQLAIILWVISVLLIFYIF
ncbi:MAG: decaprenyl-phosphate phosphoribosyltransferase [Anaerolinea sp.]|nr:decaprenyl-phosphate phosphoribosyltransferase [Anaerolinea sp.]